MGTSRNVERRTVLKAAGASAATLGLAATTGCGGDSGTSADGTVTIRYSWWGAERAGQEDQPDHRALREEVSEDQGEDGLPGLRLFLGEVPDAGRRWKSPGRFPERRRIPSEVRQEKRPARSQVPDRRGESEPGQLPCGRREGRRGRRQAARRSRRLQHHGAGHRQEGLPRKRASSRRRAGPGTSTSRPSRRSTTRPKVPGDTGYFSIMYLYDLYLRQNGKAFFTKDGLGFTGADLTEWWTDGYNRTKAGIITSPKTVAQDTPQVLALGRARRLGIHLGQLHRPLHGRGRQRLRPRAHPHH